MDHGARSIASTKETKKNAKVKLSGIIKKWNIAATRKQTKNNVFNESKTKKHPLKANTAATTKQNSSKSSGSSHNHSPIVVVHRYD